MSSYKNEIYRAAQTFNRGGNRPNDISYINKFGKRPNVATSPLPANIWDYAATAVYTYITDATTLYASSEVQTDTQPINVIGLDANGNEQAIMVTVAGTVKTVIGSAGVKWSRVYRAFNNGTTNLQGTLYIYTDVTAVGGVPENASAVKAIISSAENQTQMAIYTVPRGYNGYIHSYYAATTQGNSANIQLKTRNMGKVFRVRHEGALVGNGTSSINQCFKRPIVVSAMTDIELVVSDVSSVSTFILGGFDLDLLEDR